MVCYKDYTHIMKSCTVHVKNSTLKHFGIELSSVLFSIPIIINVNLTFNGCEGQSCPNKFIYSWLKKETNVLQCAFKLSSALAAARTLHLN